MRHVLTVLLLAGCAELPPSDLGSCDYVSGGLAGEIREVDGSTRPAFDCAGYWRCEHGSSYGGHTYAAGSVHELVEVSPGVAVLSDETAAAEAQLWCDRCEWAGESALVLVGGGWYELVSACDWGTR